MIKGKNTFLVMIVFVCFNILTACDKYESQVVPFKMPEASSNAINYDGAIIAARSFTKSEANEAFGFDIMSAGIFPVQVSFDNRTDHSIMIIPDQTFLIDAESNVWPILDQSITYERIVKKTEHGEVAPEAVKKGILLGAAGVAVGAAIGIVTATTLTTAIGQLGSMTVGKGAAIGTATGLIVGGAQGMDNYDVKFRIKDDLQSRSLQYRDIKRGELAHGFIFYPGEAKSGKVLRLQLRANNTGQISTFHLKLQ